MASAKSKVDYLKRYGYKPEELSSKKKIKRVKKTSHAREAIPKCKIVDDDIDISAVAPDLNDDNELETGDEAPQIAGFVDERPADLQKMELFATNKWRALGTDDNSDTEDKSPEGHGQEWQRHESNSDRVRHDSDSDQDAHGVSPSRKMSHDSDASPPRQRSRHDSDASPPRRTVLQDSEKGSRKTRHDSDASPTRQQSRHDSDASPPRRKVLQDSKKGSRTTRHDSDASPPRQRSRHDSDTSPPRRKTQQHSRSPPSRRGAMHDSSTSVSSRTIEQNSDSSPPRQKVKRTHDSSPPRRKTRRDISNSPDRRKNEYDSDASPPRHNVRQNSKDARSDRSSARPNDDAKQRRRNVASDYFPSKTNNSYNDSDSSLPKKTSKRVSGRNGDSDSDYSSPRDNLVSSMARLDQQNPSHSRKSAYKEKHVTRGRDQTNGSDSDPSPPRKSRENIALQKRTLDGKKAGLQDSKTLKLENKAAKERERLLFEKMEEDVSGKNAKTVLRDRSTGKRRNLEEEKRQQMEEDAIKAEQEAKYARWGKGMKQTEMQRSRLEQDLHEISKPLARYGDDEDLDKVLREQDRDGDPMLAFIKKKKATKVDGKVLPTYNGAPWPNRFGILPGYRWDGVDRTNGFEKARFARLSNKVAAEEEAYKWSVEDM